MPNILGFDLGVAHLGVALIQDEPGTALCLIDAKTMGVGLRTHADSLVAYFRPRLLPLFRQANYVGSEALTWFTKRQAANRGRHAGQELWVKLGSVHGILTSMAAEFGLPFRSIQPPALKAAVTGVRSGDKEVMLEAAQTLFPGRVWQAADHHVADAVLAGLACWARHRLVCDGRAVAQ